MKLREHLPLMWEFTKEMLKQPLMWPALAIFLGMFIRDVLKAFGVAPTITITWGNP